MRPNYATRPRSLIFALAIVGTLANPSATPSAAQAQLDHRELAADQQILHALNRLTFGAKPGEAQKVRAIGLDKWVEQQLYPSRIGNSESDRFLSRYSILQQNQNDLLRDYSEAQRDRRMARQAGDTTRAARRQAMSAGNAAGMQDIALNRRGVVNQLQSARVARAVISNRQLEEVMTDFWLNHFNVFAQKGPPQPYYLAEYEDDVIRPNALGKFRDLLGAVAKSPAMLFYLDNARSMGDSSKPRLVTIDKRRQRTMPRDAGQNLNRLRNGGLNENYGRELLELHTLGVDGGYTQQDVIDVARALTGWTIQQPAAGGGFVFRPAMHDAAEKTVLGNRFRAGRGIEDGEQVLDIVARHPSTARYIAKKLATRFVSDKPPQALVDHAAAVFLRTNGDLREVVRAIVTSNEFYAASAYRSKVKSPFEVVVSALRAMNATPDSTPRTAQIVAYLGQPIYGHQAPNGYPETGDAWMNAGAILNRINFGIAAAANRIPGARVSAIPGLETLASAARSAQVDAVSSLLLGGSVSPETRSILMSGENPLLNRSAATDVVNAAAAADMSDGTMQSNEMNAGAGAQEPRQAARIRANPLGRPGAAAPQLTGVALIVGLAIGSPEFQRR